MIGTLWTRLRLEAPSLKSPDPALDGAVMARGAAYLLLAGGLLVTVPVVADAPGASPAILLAVATSGVTLAALVALTPRSASRRLTAPLTLASTALITLAVRFGGDAAAALAILYLWNALYAAYFHSLPWLAVQLTLVACGSAIGLLGVGAPLASWIITIGAIVLTAGLFRLLRDRIYLLLALLADAARTDPLTGLLNRRAIEERLEAELARARRGGRPLTVLMADLDGFKALNDELGHRAGDEALQAIARVLRESARDSDAVARVGGDEFALLLPATDRHEAQALGQRIVARLERIPIGAPVLTLSFGTAAFPDDGATLDDLLQVADGELYDAKGTRREARPAAALAQANG